MRFVVDDQHVLIIGDYPFEIISRATSFKKPKPWFNKYIRQGLADPFVRFLKKDPQTGAAKFPTGLLHRVLEALTRYNMNVSIEDLRSEIRAVPTTTLHDNSRGEIDISTGKYSYQFDCVEAACTAGRGIIRAFTGSGKTAIGAGVIKSFDEQTLWLTSREPLLHQTRNVLKERLNQPVGILGDNQAEIERVTVAMVQTTYGVFSRSGREHIREWLRNCRVIIGDEIHHLESKQWLTVFENIPAPYRFGLSATLRLTGAGMHLEAHTGQIIADLSPDEGIRRGVIVPPRIWYIICDSPKISKTVSWPTAYKEGITNNLHRNNIICDVATTFARERKPALVLVNRLKHGQILCELLAGRGLEPGWIHGNVPTEERDVIIQGMYTGETKVIVAITQTLGEGVDIPPVRAIINATGMKGGRDAEEDLAGHVTLQILGRGLRNSPATEYLSEKTHLDYVDFSDKMHEHLINASLCRVEALEEAGYGNRIKFWSDYGKD